MSLSDDDLMAYADSELGAERRAEVESLLQCDASLRARVEALKLQREHLAAAFGDVLEEAVPSRLSALLDAPVAPAAPHATSTVSTAAVIDLADLVDLAAARASRPSLPTWAQWGGMAACLVLGVMLGVRLGDPASSPSAADISLQAGRVAAGGLLAQALGAQLASEPRAGATVAVQLSFVDQGGHYCRTFSTGEFAGLACQERGMWAVQQLSSLAGTAAQGEVRQAGSPLPRGVLDAVDQRIAGSALDATQERTARDRGWRR